MNKYELTHARHDHVFCLAPGLFRSLQKGERQKLEIVYDLGGGRRIEFKGPEMLGTDDLRVLQGLVAMAGPGGKKLTSESGSEFGQQLWRDLEAHNSSEALVVIGSFRQLAHEINYKSLDDTASLRECIERLWTVAIIVQDGGRRGYRILSQYKSDSKSGKLCIALNPRITHAVLGNGRYVYIDMEEVRRLQGGAARLIHQRLCGFIDPGKSGRIGLETLCSYVWPSATTNKNTAKTRRGKAKKALSELDVVGWDIEEYATNKWEIKRPRSHANATQIPR